VLRWPGRGRGGRAEAAVAGPRRRWLVAVTDSDDTSASVADDHASKQSNQLLIAQHPNYYSPSQCDADDDMLLVAVVDADDTSAVQHPNYYSPSQRDADDEETTINSSYYSPNHCWFPA
jgi:hypothetical protein